MTEGPILFSARMILAILAGQKTQTRRIVRPKIATCPYGQAGDRLWVRETWCELEEHHRDHRTVRQAAYKADMTPSGEECRQDYIKCGYAYRWRPSIHMPRWASRITLLVTSVRVERLQAITTDDARAEGMPSAVSAVADFAALWDEINGKRASWESSPWVWVISFRVLP